MPSTLAGNSAYKKVSKIGLVSKIENNKVLVLKGQAVTNWAKLIYLNKEDIVEVVFRSSLNDLYNKYQEGTLPELFGYMQKGVVSPTPDLTQIEAFIKAEKLKQLIREHKRQKQLLVVNLAPFHQVLPDEYIVRRARISHGTGLADFQRLNPIGDNHKDNRVLSGASLADLDFSKLRVADEVELLTSKNKIARCFAIEPILEWIPRIEEKFDERKATSRIRSVNFQRTIEQLFKQRNMFPTGIPPKIRKIAKEILKEETDKAADLRTRVHSILEELVSLHDAVKERLTERLKEIARSKK